MNNIIAASIIGHTVMGNIDYLTADEMATANTICKRVGAKRVLNVLNLETSDKIKNAVIANCKTIE